MDELTSIFPNEPHCNFYKVINGIVMILGNQYLYRTVDNMLDFFDSIKRYHNAIHIPPQLQIIQNKIPMTHPIQTFFDLIKKHWNNNMYPHTISNDFIPGIKINRTYIYEKSGPSDDICIFNTYIKCQIICNNIYAYTFYIDRMFLRSGFNEIAALDCLESKHVQSDEKTPFLNVSRATIFKRIQKAIAKHGYTSSGLTISKEKMSAIGVKYTMQFTRNCVFIDTPYKCMHCASYTDCVNFPYWDGIDPFLDLPIINLGQYAGQYNAYRTGVGKCINTYLYTDLTRLISEYLFLF